jgi:ankyrin repeat protein
VQALLAVLPPCELFTIHKALTAAVLNDHASVVAAFAAQGAPTWQASFRGLLSSAACNDSVRVAAVLVAAKADANGHTTEPPLCTAASKGHLSCVSLLLAMKACVHGARWTGIPLHHAAEHGHADVVKCLLRAKADQDRLDFFDRTPVYCAAVGMHEPALRMLLDAHADVNPPTPDHIPLFGAASYPRLPSVFQLLLGARADVNATMFYGNATLSTAIGKECPDTVVKLLLRAKADVNAATNMRRITALHNAAIHGRRTTARLLLCAKADVRAETVAGCTAAMLARQNKHFELADYLDANAGL